MRIYLDICCLKRPFDDQSQSRIRLESEAVLALLNASSERIEFVRTVALDLENEQNPLLGRAARVRRWLQSLPCAKLDHNQLSDRTAELMGLGFENFDALHLASAEGAVAEVFVTCDDKLLATAHRNAELLRIRVLDPISLSAEIIP